MLSRELVDTARRYAAALRVMRSAEGSPVLEARLRACLAAVETLPAEVERLRGLAEEAVEEVARDAFQWKADALKFQVERAALIAAERIEYLAGIRTPEDEEAERRRCAGDTLHWFKYYAWGYDPRNTVLPVQPYVPYSHQEPYIRWLDDTVMVRQVSGVVEKSRDEGATVGALDWCVHKWLFVAGFSALLVSATEALVDSKKDLNTLFEKVRFQLRLTPSWMLPDGFSLKYDLNYMNIANPAGGAAITGSAPTENVGRQKRATVVIADEFQAWPGGGFKQNVALSQTALSTVKLGTPYGAFNQYYTDTHAHGANVFVLDWRENPVKDERWYRALPFGYVGAPMTEEAIAQEVDRNYDASQPGRVLKGVREEYCFITQEELIAGFSKFKLGPHFQTPGGRFKLPDSWNWGRVTDYGESARQEDDTHIWAYSLFARPAEGWPLSDSLFFFYSLPVEPIGASELEGFQFYSGLERELGLRDDRGFVREPEVNDMSHEATDPKEVLLEKCGDYWHIPDLDFDRGRRKLVFHFELTDKLTPNIFRPELMGRARIYFVAPPGEYFLAKRERDGGYFVTPSQTQRGFLRLRREISSWHYPPEERGKPVPKMRPKPVFDDIITTVRYAVARWGVDAASMTKEERRLAQLPAELQPEAVRAQVGTPAYVETLEAQRHALWQIKKREQEQEDELYAKVARLFGGQPVNRARIPV